MEKLTLEHFIHSYECGPDGKLRLLALFNILQNIADLHADNLGLGYQNFIGKNLAWVGASYAVHIDKRPSWGDKVDLTTWPSDKTSVCAIRDFILKDKEGKTLMTATSQWALIDITTGRPQPLKRHIENLKAIPERALNSDFPTLSVPQKIDFEKRFYVRYDDIDINKHVNNAIYPVWASEAVPNDFRQSHEPEDINISFRHPAFFGDEIMVETQIDGNETLHHIMSLDKTKEFSKVKIKWKQLT
ncbi:MAG: acyl-[acyl-carrier-protein] thioesterase [Alphaproteobacteria bacterium]